MINICNINHRGYTLLPYLHDDMSVSKSKSSYMYSFSRKSGSWKVENNTDAWVQEIRAACHPCQVTVTLTKQWSYCYSRKWLDSNHRVQTETWTENFMTFPWLSIWFHDLENRWKQLIFSPKILMFHRKLWKFAEFLLTTESKLMRLISETPCLFQALNPSFKFMTFHYLSMFVWTLN